MIQKFRKAIAVEKRLAVALWRLSTGNSYWKISKVFGIEKSTVIKIVREVTREHFQLSSEFINFPLTTLEHGIAIKAFSEHTNCSTPQVVGAIDGTHIDILRKYTAGLLQQETKIYNKDASRCRRQSSVS